MFTSASPSRIERGAITRGVRAGMAGALALSLNDALERALLGRPPVYAPARIAARLAGRPCVPGSRAGMALRFPYAALIGSALGASRRWLPARPLYAGAVLGAAVGAFELAVLPAVGATPSPRTWTRAERALFLVHTLVFGLVTAAAHEA